MCNARAARSRSDAAVTTLMRMVDVEIMASEEWAATLSGGATEIPVGDLTSVADGSVFPGFEAGMYLVGMQYTIGTNPAPLYLSVVNIEE